ncbi:UDP-Glycosyltransferase/glycogen phosphorylase [Sodiomyces alkalinus F11]|uniref:UDP-Glycosyltransferase/glycogen phosphorylase n=1 Tax=Sodiomyces alkalinus (strain CBS 110278 / VKM F-3762 / F11) TaxID=1314773 RepID=A0A3N2PTM9_SODAK|nr:UDP-Glycosyltransferase/glycogen phosphorylase [Sodiomyces alkalinus F11]ROT37794.1 UDP-Glycosyltransferase/glycogen phosphorylase [Sodiomyces alkalinus F11]
MATNGDALAAAVNGTNGTTNGTTKPHLLFCALPGPGHTLPILQIAEEMAARGYSVSFLGGKEFFPKIEKIGAEPIEAAPFFSMDLFKIRVAVPEGFLKLIFDIEKVFMAYIPTAFQQLKDALEMLRRRYPDREVVVVHESYYFGALPFMHGAPLPEGFDKFPRTLNIHIGPVWTTSKDTAPFGPGLHPDSTPSGQDRNRLLNDLMYGPDMLFKSATETLATVMTDAGVPDFPVRTLNFLDAVMQSYDVTLQLSAPSLEYHRSDLHHSIKFAGWPPEKPISTGFDYPEWWAEVVRGDKKVIAVSQGTVATEYVNLLIPAIQGLAHRDDVLVIALLGSRGRTLEDVPIPANTRVVDYFSYDVLLKKADVWIMNAGWGGFQQGVVNGVPMVLAGNTEDKPEVAARAAYSGVAIDLKTGKATPEAIAAAVGEILANDKYKKRIMEIKAETEALPTYDIIEEHIIKA